MHNLTLCGPGQIFFISNAMSVCVCGGGGEGELLFFSSPNRAHLSPPSPPKRKKICKLKKKEKKVQCSGCNVAEDSPSSRH